MYVSKAELQRAQQQVADMMGWYWKVEQPPQGEPGFLEDLIARGRAFLEKHPDHQAAHTRVAILEEERELREEGLRKAWQTQRNLAQQWEKLHGHECPGHAAGYPVGDSVPCWVLAERQGWTCALTGDGAQQEATP